MECKDPTRDADPIGCILRHSDVQTLRKKFIVGRRLESAPALTIQILPGIKVAATPEVTLALVVFETGNRRPQANPGGYHRVERFAFGGATLRLAKQAIDGTLRADGPLDGGRRALASTTGSPIAARVLFVSHDQRRDEAPQAIEPRVHHVGLGRRI